jgi:PIN domain nuclease of toxin-antitoxin system
LNLLLDTHTWLWALSAQERLPSNHRRMISDPRNGVFVSSISVWETVIKKRLGKLRVEADYVQISAEMGIVFLPFDTQDAQAVDALPMHHNDPFDRAILAQALANKYTLLTSDEALGGYSSIVSVDLA